jgi:hypothetical protein
VDESVQTLTMMVSWHDPSLPVSLSLITPSQKVIKAGSAVVFNQRGDSFSFFRVDEPEPGEWQMVVRSERQDGEARWATHRYTFGAYGKSPLAIEVDLPRDLARGSELKVTTRLAGADVARSVRFSATVNTPRLSTDDLVAANKDALAQLDLGFEPDSPRVDVNLFRLAALDRARAAQGQASLFSLRHRRLSLTRTNGYSNSLATPIAGLLAVRISVGGRTDAGFQYRRQVNFDVIV